METVVLVIHLLVAITLVGCVLLQRSEGGGLGMGGGGGGGFMTGRATANLLTRATAVLAAGFFLTSMTLAIIHSGNSKPTSILDAGGPVATEAPAPAPAEPAGPSVPLAQ